MGDVDQSYDFSDADDLLNVHEGFEHDGQLIQRTNPQTIIR